MKTKIIRLDLDTFAVHEQGDNHTIQVGWDEIEKIVNEKVEPKIAEFIFLHLSMLKVGDSYFILG